VIPQQQLDTQAALVGQFDGAIASDQSQIDNAKLQLTYSRINRADQRPHRPASR